MTDTTTTTESPSTTDSDTPPDTSPPADQPLFTDFGVAQDLADELSNRGIVHPFPIQELTLPLGLKGHDIIGQARTGTGKTLGFGLPLLQRIDTSRAQTQALVIVPTRELCIQVADDLTVGAGRGITSIAVYGGVGYDEQIEALTTGVHVVVGTPGRTLDHLGRGNLDVSGVHTVVLDEADEMLDMGFLPDVERLLADVPEDRQTLLFSATMPTAIVKLARRFMAKPTFMRADETLHETAPTVDQHFFLVHRMDKPRVLARLLQKPDRGGAFVFCRTKRMCDRLVRELDDLGITAIAVHGDLRQSSREKNLDRFRDGRADVLVATEVAARGLDVDKVTHVVNYDCPDDEKMYLHRIGRTARAGQSGVAVTFAEFNEVDRVNVIRKRVGTEQDLVEIFSTSDELTELFDLPETTPWDALAGSDSSNGSGRSPRSGSGSGSGSSRGDRSSRATSSGGNRSSGRGSDRGGRDRSSSRRDDRSSSRSSRSTSGSSDNGSGDTSGDSSSRRSRSSRRSSSDSSRSSDSTRSSDSSRSSRSSDSTRSSSDSSTSSDSSRSRTRTRTRSRDDDAGGRTRRNGDRDASPTSSSGSDTSREATPDTGPSDDRSSDTSSSASSGSGRKRARRNRARGGRKPATSSDASSSTTTTRDSDGSSDRAETTGTSSTRSRGRSSDRSSRSSGRSSSRSDGDGDRRTTSRGSEARGEGTPRLDRRVDVEHLP